MWKEYKRDRARGREKMCERERKGTSEREAERKGNINVVQ